MKTNQQIDFDFFNMIDDSRKPMPSSFEVTKENGKFTLTINKPRYGKKNIHDIEGESIIVVDKEIYSGLSKDSLLNRMKELV